jgi:hypothetical protein
MNFAYNVIFIFVPSRHPQLLMIPFCPKSDGKLAKLNLEVINNKFDSKLKQKLPCFHGNSVVPPFLSPTGIFQKTLKKE